MAKAAKSAPAKYADKSAGQPELLPLFNSIRKLVMTYAKGNYVAKADKPGHYELYYNKEVEQAGKTYPEICFASVLIQKGYVGFYFFPVYVDVSLAKELDAELLKTLKGKTCFHIRAKDSGVLNAIRDALKTGYRYYQSKGWK